MQAGRCAVRFPWIRGESRNRGTAFMRVPALAVFASMFTPAVFFETTNRARGGQHSIFFHIAHMARASVLPPSDL
eukprot:11193633-Lingulodinium_polyedra.AAC.1